MSFQTHYNTALAYENTRSNRHADMVENRHAALQNYANAIRYVMPDDVQNSNADVQHTIHYLETWLTKQEARWLPRADDLIEYVETALATWYGHTYVLRGGPLVAGELNYAPAAEDDATRLEDELHTLWQEKKSQNLSNKDILQEIRQRRPTETTATIIPITQAFFQSPQSTAGTDNPEKKI